MQHKSQSPEEGLVDVVNEVCGEYNDPWKSLYVVEEDSHVDISIAISGCAGGRVEDDKGNIAV